MRTQVQPPDEQERPGKRDADHQVKPRGRPRREGLDALDRRMIAALLAHPTRAAAATSVGVSEKTIQRRFHQARFREEYFRQLDGLLAEQWSTMTAVRGELWDRFMELVRNENPSVALRATTWYFDHMARRMPSLQLRPHLDQDEVEPPAGLRELYEGLEDAGAEADGGDEG